MRCNRYVGDIPDVERNIEWKFQLHILYKDVWMQKNDIIHSGMDPLFKQLSC